MPWSRSNRHGASTPDTRSTSAATAWSRARPRRPAPGREHERDPARGDEARRPPLLPGRRRALGALHADRAHQCLPVQGAGDVLVAHRGRPGRAGHRVVVLEPVRGGRRHRGPRRVLPRARAHRGRGALARRQPRASTRSRRGATPPISCASSTSPPTATAASWARRTATRRATWWRRGSSSRRGSWPRRRRCRASR